MKTKLIIGTVALLTLATAFHAKTGKCPLKVAIEKSLGHELNH